MFRSFEAFNEVSLTNFDALEHIKGDNMNVVHSLDKLISAIRE